MIPLLLEAVAVIVGFAVAAELVAIGTDKLEPLIGQGMAGGVVLGLVGALPETAFVVIATLQGSFGIAIGSAIGGNVILFTLGMGIVGLVYILKWKKPILMKDDYHVETWFLLASAFAMMLLLIYGSLDIISGSALLLIYAAYLVYRYRSSSTMIKSSAATHHGRTAMYRSLVYIAAGAAIVFVLSGTFVQLISNASGILGISAVWLALVISPLAADIDEILTSFRLATRSIGGGSTAIVSLIGSKLQNNTMLIGLIGILAVSRVSVAGADVGIMAVVAIDILAVFIIGRGKLTRIVSALLILIYFAVIAAAFLL